jgi:hypothetical protein
MDQDLYAYTLRNQEPGWAWHVYDFDGLLVASGLENSQDAAAAAIHRVIRGPAAAQSPMASVLYA